jgi:peptide chain release factor 2
MAREESDDATLQALAGDTQGLENTVAEMEFRRMFSGAMDSNNCFLDIQSGSGGTEAQDWTSILERMYCVIANPKNSRSSCWKNRPVRSPASRAPR